MRLDVMLLGLSLCAVATAQQTQTDPASGLVQAEGWETVLANCSGCHSINLVTQNRGDREHWLKLIRWMQDSQNLWDLGAAEPTILDYLAEHYGAPAVIPRRIPLGTIWLDTGMEESR